MNYICIAGDQNYYESIATLIFSINENISQKIKIYLLTDDGFDEKNFNIIKNTDKIDILHIKINNEDLTKFKLKNYFTAATFYKILLDKYLPEEVNKILYLDSDTLVINNIDSIFDFDISNYYLAAVEEFSGGNFQKRLDMRKESSYFNAGILLMNLKKIREDKKLEEVRNLLNNNRFKWLDQDGLNKVFDGNWIKLEKSWNYHRYYVLNSLLENTEISDDIKIIHYTGKIKPWFNQDVNPLKFYYAHYYEKTFNKQLKLKNNILFYKEYFKINFIFKSKFFRNFYQKLRKIKHRYI